MISQLIYCAFSMSVTMSLTPQDCLQLGDYTVHVLFRGSDAVLFTSLFLIMSLTLYLIRYSLVIGYSA